MNHGDTTQNPIFVGLVRRLLSMVYDLILLIALLFLATIIATAFNHGEAIKPGNPYYVFYVLALLAIGLFYYGWFWTHGGQTLGMKTWKVKLQSRNTSSNNNLNVSWQQALIRASTALVSIGLVGLGFAWALFDKRKRAWHDITSKTELIDLRIKPPN